MITGRTVFVLGAGASQPFGLPLGNELYQRVIDHFAQNTSHTNEFFKVTSFAERDLRPFVEALHYSGLTSVDAFLERRTEFVDIGKAVMALELMKGEIHGNLWNASQNWMKYLYTRMSTDTLEQFAQNTVSFITYNYDRTLEHFLHTSLMNTYGKSEEKCAEVLSKIAIKHLHGRLGYLPWQSERDVVPFGLNPIDARYMEICQREIRIVHEDIADRDTDFNIARRILHEAKLIYFMGFGYGAKNVERLMFEQVKAEHAEGTAAGLTNKESTAITAVFQGKVRLHDVDCLRFLRERAVLD